MEVRGEVCCNRCIELWAWSCCRPGVWSSNAIEAEGLGMIRLERMGVAREILGVELEEGMDVDVVLEDAEAMPS